jgi:hypothetical protein
LMMPTATATWFAPANRLRAINKKVRSSKSKSLTGFETLSGIIYTFQLISGKKMCSLYF